MSFNSLREKKTNYSIFERPFSRAIFAFQYYSNGGESGVLLHSEELEDHTSRSGRMYKRLMFKAMEKTKTVRLSLQS